MGIVTVARARRLIQFPIHHPQKLCDYLVPFSRYSDLGSLFIESRKFFLTPRVSCVLLEFRRDPWYQKTRAL